MMPARTQKTLPRLTILALLLSGCAVGPDYQRPDDPLPAAYTGPSAEAVAAAEAAAKTPVPVNPDWWTLFGEAELNRLIEAALVRNHDLAAAAARLEAAEAAARAARSDFFPSFNLGASSGRNRSSGETVSGKQTGVITADNRRAAIDMSYELDLWGRLRRASESADASALAGRFAHDAMRLTIAGQVASAYLTLRVLDAELATTARMRDSRRQTLDLVVQRVDAGLSSTLEQAQAKGALAAVEAQWNQLRRQRALAENLLGLLTGQPGLTLAASDAFDRLPLPPTPPAGLPSRLLEARPDVREAEETLIAANARIGVARAAYFPNISLTGAIGSESAQIADLFGNKANIWSYGASLLMPIFNWGRTSASVDQATAAQKEALANYLKTVETAFREVKDALVSLQELSAEAEALTLQTDAAREAYRIAEARYKVGQSGFLELLDSQRTLNAAELQQQTARRDQLAAAVDLFKALGGGWQPGAAHGGSPAAGGEEAEASASTP